MPESAGLTFALCEQAAWAITASGRRYRGAGAINAALATALGVRLPLRLYRLPGIHQFQNRVYAWTARHRYRFPGTTPHCASHPQDCGE